MWMPILISSNRGEPLCRFMQFQKEAQQIFHKFGPLFDQLTWETEQYTLSTRKAHAYFFCLRHFMLAKHDIELEKFKDWLPPNCENDTYDVWPQTHCMGGDDEGFVFLELGMHEEGLRQAKQNVLRYPFNPVGLPTNYLALTRLGHAIGQTTEANESRKMALRETRR